jgi:stage V sporulation protein G
MASCRVGDAIYLTGMRVIHGKHGRFVSMPARQDKNGEYHDIFFPASKEVRDSLMEKVLQAYDAELAKAGQAA